MPDSCKADGASLNRDSVDAWQEVLSEIANASKQGELETFLDELLTAPERRDIALRWIVLKSLAAGEPQRRIADRMGMSLCKITRGSKMLKRNGYVGRKFTKSKVEKEKDENSL